MNDKVNIYYETTDLFLGFDNISWEYVEDIYNGSCSEIFCNGAFEYSENEIIEKILLKIKHQGKVSLIGNELHEISRDLHNRNLTVEEAGKKLWGGRQRVYSLRQIEDLLVEKGFTIMKRRVNDYQFFVEAIRN